jgi:hypothetical protein
VDNLSTDSNLQIRIYFGHDIENQGQRQGDYKEQEDEEKY